MLLFVLISLFCIKDSNLSQFDQFCSSYLSVSIINNFDNFSSINISACYKNETNLRIIANGNLVLNKDLDIDLRNQKFKNLHVLEFHHLKGIDVTTNFSLFQNRPSTDFSMIYLINCDFMFYHKNKIIGENDCNSKELFHSFNSLFRSLSDILVFNDCSYKENICILNFKNSLIKNLFFTYQSNSALRKNYLKFSNTVNLSFSLNSNIETVLFDDLYRISLNLNLLNDQVFK